MINVTNISKHYGDVAAVNGISFVIREGEITGLLGPNGAGKTTTLRILTSYLAPDSGSVSIGDHDALLDPLSVKKIIGYLPESAPLYGDMLVYDFLCFAADIREIDRSRIRAIASLCGINEVMHKNVSELSKGYKQRVGLAYAMMHDPKILILDEPTSGLDPNQIIEIRNLIKEIGKKKTVILSTHILSEVEATCDRVIIIDRGNIIADDRTENLRKSSVGDRNIQVTLAGTDFGAMKNELMAIGGVAAVTEQPGNGLVSAAVTVQGGRDVRPDIFRAVRDRGWILYEMKQDQMSLEKVFRELTRGGGHE